jgi:hypothetical protein
MINEASIEELAYIMREIKKNNEPKPIVFLGAGASVTRNIPQASDIVKDILASHSDNPKVKNLQEKSPNYAQLMECLRPTERNKLLKTYIDEAKINVTH